MNIDRATFLNLARNFKRRSVEVEGIGTVFVREVSAAQAREQAASKADDMTKTATLVSHVLCDVDGNRLLTDADIESLKALPIRVLKSIGDAAAELSSPKKNETLTTESSSSPSVSA
jgi:hypothetical protein